ncbi:hypothetical protein AACH06_17625 [Ideonella sp. DXS29W]|uniref:HTH arsR-type domain-containing protein n=1 Tax=Ideonella lacteola TaxID=2984193 RepID=A0ABU9BUV7_9BURK
MAGRSPGARACLPAGLLRRETRGNRQVYSANTSGLIFVELASILRKTSAMADGSDAQIDLRVEGNDGR